MTSLRQARQRDWPPRIDQMQREIERFFDQFHRGLRPPVAFTECIWSPQLDVYEADGNLVILVDLAGVDRDEIQIEVEHERLMLRGERRPSHHRGLERTFYMLEIPYCAFERSIRLPFAVDASKAEASYRDGFLEVVMPRLAEQEPRRVEIRSTESGSR